MALLVIAGLGAGTLAMLGPPAAASLAAVGAKAGVQSAAKGGKTGKALATAASARRGQSTVTTAAAAMPAMRPLATNVAMTRPAPTSAATTHAAVPSGAVPSWVVPNGAVPSGAATKVAASGALLAPATSAAPKPGWPGPAIAAVFRPNPAIPPPDAALLASDPGSPGVMLPRIGADGRQPMQEYAAVPSPAEGRPTIAMVVSGLGLAAADSEVAIDKLPAAVDLAFSPYAVAPDALLAQARAHGHEILVSIPMEPQGYPLNDPGSHALLVANSAAQNLAALDWALARIPGAVGATAALDGMRGERLAATPDAFDAMLRALAGRGLLYVDPRPGAPAPALAAGRSVDVVVDAPPDPAAIDAALARLEARARAHGSALGLAGPLRPVTLRHLIAWATGLGARGFVLTPASAIARRAATTAAE